jgi:hypothetical protein
MKKKPFQGKLKRRERRQEVGIREEPSLPRQGNVSMQGLLNHLSQDPRIVGCRCDATGTLICKELGKISWNNPSYEYLHFRFDGCICSDSGVNKCDCIIFRFRSGQQPVMFAVETKKKKPKFSLAKKQIEFCLAEMIDALPNPKNLFAVTPVICAKKIKGSLKDRALHDRVNIFGKKRLIVLREYGQDINNAP